MRITKSSRGGETTRGTSGLTLMQEMVTLEGGATFSNVSTLARLSGERLAYHESQNITSGFGFKTTNSTKCI